MIDFDTFKKLVLARIEEDQKRGKSECNFSYFQPSDTPDRYNLNDFYRHVIKGERFIKYVEIDTEEKLKDLLEYTFFHKGVFSIDEYGDLAMNYGFQAIDSGDGNWIFPDIYTVKKKGHRFDKQMMLDEIGWVNKKLKEERD